MTAAEDMSHRRVAETMAAWCLRQPWAQLAAYEVGIGAGVADVLAVTDPRRVPVNPEHAATSAAEAAEIRRLYFERLGRPGRERPAEAARAAHAEVRRTVPPILPPRSHEPRPRVVVVEVKRTRADLLGDLRARKLLKYEEHATHCYLAGTGEALRWQDDAAAVLADLGARGLPTTWGVVFVTQPAWWGCQVLRPAKRLQEATPALVYEHAWAVGVSLSHRVLSGAV